VHVRTVDTEKCLEGLESSDLCLLNEGNQHGGQKQKVHSFDLRNGWEAQNVTNLTLAY